MTEHLGRQDFKSLYPAAGRRHNSLADTNSAQALFPLALVSCS